MNKKFLGDAGLLCALALLDQYKTSAKRIRIAFALVNVCRKFKSCDQNQKKSNQFPIGLDLNCKFG